MSEYRLRFDGLMDGHDFPNQLVLPFLPSLPSANLAKRAIDSAVTRRSGVLLLGSKGEGKTGGARQAAQWFDDIQRAKYERDNNHRRLRVVRVFGPRDTDYWSSAVRIATDLNRRYNPKVGARKKDKNEVRRELIEMALSGDRVVIVLDEGEKCSDDTLFLLRDIMSESEEVDLQRNPSANGHRAAGIGVVLTGTSDLQSHPAIREELGHRWSEVLAVPDTKPGEAARIYEAWLPGFAAHIREAGQAAWRNYISSLTRTAGKRLTLKLLVNHTRLYVLAYARNDSKVNCIEKVEFDENLFTKEWNRSLGGDE